MMYKIKNNVPFEQIQVICDDIPDFYAYCRLHISKNITHPIRAYITSIEQELIYYDVCHNNSYTWYVLDSPFGHYLESLSLHPLEAYIELMEEEKEQER